MDDADPDLLDAVGSGSLPTHLDLPESDGAVVDNFQEHPQSILLSGCLRPRLMELHPNGDFAIGQDSGIYFRLTEPPLDGCRAPDWFYVPGVPPRLQGRRRRSYVLWAERVPPTVVIEYVSGDGSEERDRTPQTGKFWIYENAIRAGFYAIFDADNSILDVYRHDGTRFVPVPANARGRYPVPPLRVELGLWRGYHFDAVDLWLRAWDIDTGEMLPSEEEFGASQRRRADDEQRRADQAEEVLDDTRDLLTEEVERSRAERLRAEQATRQAEAERLAKEEATRQAEQATRQAEQATRQAEAERLAKEAALEQARRMRELLRAAGIDPDAT